MRLFVDDMRPCPSGDNYLLCRNYEDAIWEMSVTDFDYVSLDYSLGYGEKTGYDILVWMKKSGKIPRHINIHSSHPWGRRNMKDFCDLHFPNVEVTMDSPY
ncbi:MAG: cell division protein FtsJ [Clostridia bacterium]|nr:cell division protein FtsJ [Clostridia bacterium]